MPIEDEIVLTIQDVPEVIGGVDLSALNLDAREGFIFGQIDGAMTISNLKIISKFPEKEILKIVEKLMRAGALRIKEKAQPLSEKRYRARTELSNSDSFVDKVRRLYLDLENMNYYELLGVDPNADKEAVKKAFYKVTKEFHPDKFFRGEDSEIRDRLQTIFARINIAYKFLVDPQKRREYDTAIKKGRDVTVSAMEEKDAPVSPQAPQRPSSSNSQQAAARPSIKNPFMDNVLKANRLFEGALTEIKKKNYPSARQNLRIAASLDPYNNKYVELMQKLEKLETIEQAKKHYQEGLKMESEGEYKEAARLYREAMLLDTDNSLYYTRLGRINYEQEKSSELAKRLFKKAIELNPSDVENYLFMGRILLDNRQIPASIAQFEKGLEIDPKNKELSKELKRAKKER